MKKSKGSPGKISLILSMLFFIFIAYWMLKGWGNKLNLFMTFLAVYWLIWYIFNAIKYIKKKEKYNAIILISQILLIL